MLDSTRSQQLKLRDEIWKVLRLHHCWRFFSPSAWSHWQLIREGELPSTPWARANKLPVELDLSRIMRGKQRAKPDTNLPLCTVRTNL